MFALNFFNLFIKVVSLLIINVRVFKRLFLLSITPPRFFSLISMLNALMIYRRRLNRINLDLVDVAIVNLNLRTVADPISKCMGCV